MTDVDLAALADAGAFVSHEHQDLIAGRFGAAPPVVDPAAGTVRFTDREGVQQVVRAHLLGTSSPTDGTWLWAWQNINGFPDAFVRQARRIRSFGEKHGIAEFTTATLPLDEDLPLRLLRAVKAVTGITAHLSAPTGTDETRAWLLLDDPSLALPTPTAVRAAGVVATARSGSGVIDHRRALTAWAAQRGVELQEEGDGLRVRLADGALRVRFDDGNRISAVTTRLGPDAAPAPEQEPVPDPVAPPEPEQRRGLFGRLFGGR